LEEFFRRRDLPGQGGDSFARSLLEHCVGRAWVFTDVGLDEFGARIFAFTHRSFMEYFAANHLVREYSTTEGLATEIVAALAANSSSLVPQLAFELKARTSNTAAYDLGSAVLSVLSIPHVAFMLRCGSSTLLPRRLCAQIAECLGAATDEESEGLRTEVLSMHPLNRSALREAGVVWIR
jgi:hypothetical protein